MGEMGMKVKTEIGEVESVGGSEVDLVGESEMETRVGGEGDGGDEEVRSTKRMRVEVVIRPRKVQKELYTFCLGREARKFLYG